MMKPYHFLFIFWLIACDAVLLPEEDYPISLEENLATPIQLDDGIEISTPTAEHIDSAALKEVVTRIYSGQPERQIRSLLIARNNKLVLESYYNGWHIDRKQDIRSATKSFTSALTGIAIDQGLIQDPHQPILDFFPEYENYLNWEEQKSEMTIEDFLRMRTGLACNDDFRSSPDNEENMYETADWIKFILDLPTSSEAGEQFSYCTGAPVTLGGIISNISGQRIPEFADAHLFSRLGITDYAWEYMPSGRADTGGHLHLRSRDMLKFGLLYVNGGEFQGASVVSADWVATSTTMTGSARGLGYAYLWWGITWMIEGEEVDAFFASGNGGQLILVVPSLEAVVVWTGGNYNNDWLSPCCFSQASSFFPLFGNRILSSDI